MVPKTSPVVRPLHADATDRADCRVLPQRRGADLLPTKRSDPYGGVAPASRLSYPSPSPDRRSPVTVMANRERSALWTRLCRAGRAVQHWFGVGGGVGE